MPSVLGYHPHLDAVVRVGAGVQVLHVEPFACQVRLHVVGEAREGALVERLVNFAPINAAVAGSVANYELVFRRTARELAGVDYQGARMIELSFAVGQGVLVEQRWR